MKFGNVSSDCLILRTEAAAVRRDGAGVPVAFRVFRPGPLSLTIDGQQVAGELTREDVQSILDYHRMKGEAIPVDCEHLLQVLADLRGIEEAELVRTEPLLAEKGAAGFVRLTEENGELWAVVEKWAPRARELLSSAGDAIYNYFSPVLRGLRKPPLRLTSFALTNVPAINDLDALAAVGERTIGRMSPAMRGTNEEPTMDVMKKLIELLKLDAAAFAGEHPDLNPILAAALSAIESGRKEAADFVQGVKDSLGLSDGDGLPKAAGLVVSLAAAAKADKAALADANAKIAGFEKAQFDRTVADLQSAGKLTEAMQQSAWFKGLDLAALTEWSKAAPVIVPMQRGPQPVVPEDGAVSPALERVARTCGIDPKKVAAANRG